jgi:hypothetical protein
LGSAEAGSAELAFRESGSVALLELAKRVPGESGRSKRELAVITSAAGLVVRGV